MSIRRYVVQPPRTKSRATCVDCGHEAPAFAFRTERVPGVGAVQRCRGKHQRDVHAYSGGARA